MLVGLAGAVIRRAFAFVLLVCAGAAAGVAAPVVVPVAVPPQLLWDYADYPVAPLLTLDGGIVVSGSAAYDPFASATFKQTAAGAQFYVAAGGADTSNCTLPGSACRTITHAIELANARGRPARIHVIAPASGNLPKDACAISVLPKTDLIISAAGRVRCGAYDASLGWKPSAVYPNLYEASRTQAARVVDPAKINRYGYAVEYAHAVSAAACALQAGSWYSDGGYVYVHPFGSKPIDDSQARVYLAMDLWAFVYADQPPNIFITGDGANDGFDLEGGYRSTLLVSGAAARPASKSIFAVRNSSFRYGGEATRNSGGVYVNRWYGMFYAGQSEAGATWSDNWNFHDAGVSLGGGMYVLTVNVQGADSGRAGYGVISNNGWTAHEDVAGIDVAGKYQGARGQTVSIIDQSTLLGAGTRAYDSLGDIDLGGIFVPTEFATGGSAQMWLDHGKASASLATNEAIVARDSSTIFTHDMIAVKGLISNADSGLVTRD